MHLPPFFRLLFIGIVLGPSIGWSQLERVANTSLTLPGDLPSPTGYGSVNALGTLTFRHPICIAAPPGVTNRLFIVERNLGVQMVNLDNLTQSTFLALSTYLTAQSTPLQTGGECGILSLAFHPNYNQNGYFYVFFSLNVGGVLHQRVARFQASGTAGSYNAATVALATGPTAQQPLITQLDQASNHNGGDMAFGADGYLYISTGDEGGGGDEWGNSRFINRDYFSAILRIDVDSKAANALPQAHPAVHAGTYRIPADNPFIGATTHNQRTIDPLSVRTEIWATGLRNPWRMAFDPPTGRLFCADVGQGAREEVNLITRGGDYGWAYREGTANYNYTDPDIPVKLAGFTSIDPIHDYPRSDGYSITGGVVYRGNRLTELAGRYVFADYGSGNVWTLRETGGTWTRELLLNLGGVVEFGVDPRDGEALFCTLGSTAIIRRLARSGTSGTPPPVQLSLTGAFANLENLTPHAGLVGYAPNVDFWSDHAVKSRWFAIKNTTDRIAFSADGNWTFPTGMVWVKHFDFDLVRGNATTRRRLETRILVKTATDIYGLSYRWNNIASGAQTDAQLVVEEGENLAVPGSNPAQTWRFPSRSECRVCHTPPGGFALSFATRQLNRSHLFGLQTQNQISALSSAGYFHNPPGGVHTLPAFARADDTTQSLEWRVRSYLAVNCVQCHQPGGAAQGIWDARATTPTDAASLINGLLVNNGGDPEARFAVKDDAPAFALAHSMVLKRLRGDGVPRMPPLATNERDLDAEALLTAWITQELPSRQSFAQWQAAQLFATPEAASPSADPDGDGVNNTTEYLRRTNPKAPNLPSSPLVAMTSTGNVEVSFAFPGNRSCVIESSVNLQDWTPWNVPENTAKVPAADGARTITAPIDGVRRFFRARITAP